MGAAADPTCSAAARRAPRNCGRQIGGISEKMLIQTLRRLERNGFITRRLNPKCRRASNTR